MNKNTAFNKLSINLQDENWHKANFQIALGTKISYPMKKDFLDFLQRKPEIIRDYPDFDDFEKTKYQVKEFIDSSSEDLNVSEKERQSWKEILPIFDTTFSVELAKENLNKIIPDNKEIKYAVVSQEELSQMISELKDMLKLKSTKDLSKKIELPSKYAERRLLSYKKDKFITRGWYLDFPVINGQEFSTAVLALMKQENSLDVSKIAKKLQEYLINSIVPQMNR